MNSLNNITTGALAPMVMLKGEFMLSVYTK